MPIIARRFTTTAPGPMEALNIDYLGPFPADAYGNMYVLTVIDTLSRAVGLYAVSSLEAIHTARMLIRHVGLFGCPSQIVSDRGTHFTAEIIRELMQMLGTDHVLTLAASKQENAAVAQEFTTSIILNYTSYATHVRRNFSGQCCLIIVSFLVGLMFFLWCSVS